MLLNLVLDRKLAAGTAAAIVTLFGAASASANNEQYQLFARTCSPYIVNGCDEQVSEAPLANGLNVGGGYAFASGYNGGVALASAVFDPGAPELLAGGTYEQGSIGYMTYTFQVQGAPNTLVPLHMMANVSVSAIHLTDPNGNVATLVDGVNGAPSDLFKIVASASVQVSATRLTPYPDSGASASFEAIYNPLGRYYYCSGCGGGSDAFDTTVWVYSNSDINVTLNTSTLLRYFADGTGGSAPLFASVSAETDPTFSIDDPAYSGFSIVGVPTGFPPPVSAGVPEPAAWAMMLAGFGMAGSAIRSRKRKPALAC